MKRSRCFLIGMPIAVAAVGPVVYFGSFAVQIGLGMAGTAGLSNPAFALRLLGGLVKAGARVGLLGGLAAAVTRCRPRESAMLAAGVGLAFRSVETVYLAVAGKIVPGYLGLAAGEALLDSAAIAATGYLTAVFAAAVDHRWPEPEAPAPQARVPDRRYRL